jgi:hypothetical protein
MTPRKATDQSPSFESPMHRTDRGLDLGLDVLGSEIGRREKLLQRLTNLCFRHAPSPPLQKAPCRSSLVYMRFPIDSTKKHYR